jgi:phospholipid transport system substrate-binding protein
MSPWKIGAFAIVLGAAAPATALPAAAQTDPAVQQVQTFYATLVDTMKRGPALGVQGRYHALETAVDTTFDLPAMMQIVVGTGWTSLSEPDKQALIAAFRRMTIANYASNFAKFNGERFNVDPTVQHRNADEIVQSTLVPAGGNPVPFIYRMHQSAGAWKVIDIFLEGYVSELAMRRSDFASTLASGGAPALSAKMNQIADNLLGGGKGSR